MEVQSLGCFWQPSPQKNKQICILHSTTTHTYVRQSFKSSSPNCSIPTLASSSLLFPSVTLSLSALTPLPISPPFIMRQERLSSQAPLSILFSETPSSLFHSPHFSLVADCSPVSPSPALPAVCGSLAQCWSFPPARSPESCSGSSSLWTSTQKNRWNLCYKWYKRHNWLKTLTFTLLPTKYFNISLIIEQHFTFS